MRDNLSAFPSTLFAPGGTHLSIRGYTLLLLLCFGFFLPGLACLPPTDRDESSFAQASKQMIETGNYLDIRLHEKPRYQKPIGIYWLQALSVRLLAPSHLNEIWAYRVPSLVGGMLAVLMTAMTGALLFNARIGFIAGVMMMASMGLNAEAHLAKTDAVLLATVTTMQFALARAYHARETGWQNFLLFWCAIGIGILIKGPIILLVLASTLAWLRWQEKTLAWFAPLRPLLGIPLAFILVAPWFVAISYASHGAFLAQSAGHDMLAKVWEGQNRSWLPPGMHLLVFPLVFFPFSLLAVLSWPDSWSNRAKPAVRFCLGWIIPTWIVFELSMTKLPQYALPTYPAIAMLAAKALDDGFPALADGNKRWLLSLTATLWLMVGMAIAVGCAFAPLYFGGDVDYGQILAGMTLVLSQGVALLLLSQKKKGCVVVMAAGNLLFLTVLLNHTAPDLKHVWLSNEIVQAADHARPCASLQIVSSAYNEPSLAFLAGTNTKRFNDATMAANALKRNICAIAVVDATHLNAFLNAFPDQPAPHAVATIEGYNSGHGGAADLTLYTMPSLIK